MSMRSLVTLAALVAAWCAVWGNVSVANVASGVIVGAVALRFGKGWRSTGGIRIIPLLRLSWLVTVDLVMSTVTVVREVLTPTDYTDEAVIAVPIPPVGRRHLFLLYTAITVTPGTAVVAASTDADVLYLHVLHVDRRAEIESHVRQLAQLAELALPSADETIERSPS